MNYKLSVTKYVGTALTEWVIKSIDTVEKAFNREIMIAYKANLTLWFGTETSYPETKGK